MANKETTKTDAELVVMTINVVTPVVVVVLTEVVRL